GRSYLRGRGAPAHSHAHADGDGNRAAAGLNYFFLAGRFFFAAFFGRGFALALAFTLDFAFAFGFAFALVFSARRFASCSLRQPTASQMLVPAFASHTASFSRLICDASVYAICAMWKLPDASSSGSPKLWPFQ